MLNKHTRRLFIFDLLDVIYEISYYYSTLLEF